MSADNDKPEVAPREGAMKTQISSPTLLIVIIVFSSKFGMGNCLIPSENMIVMILLGGLLLDLCEPLLNSRTKISICILSYPRDAPT